jgi:hypothetical protein
LHRSPESRDDLSAVLCIACHGCQLYIHAKGQCLFKLPSPRNISAGTVPGVVINHGRGRRRGRAGAMLLLAPQSGRKTRANIRQKTLELPSSV